VVADRSRDRSGAGVNGLARLTSTGFGIYLCIVGAVLAATAIGLFVKRLRMSSGLRADGQIVGYHQRIQQRATMKPQYMPIVRFQPRSGPPIEFQSRMGSHSKRLSEGTLVRVAYRADRSEQAEIATAARMWLAPPLLLLFALACIAIAWRAGG
jgi:hypothetical protein